MNWKKIKKYKKYSVSDTGLVRNDNTGRILKQHLRTGYLLIKLFENNKGTTYSVHRLVGELFIPNPNNYTEINHKDENKINNKVENLEWCTSKYNSNYGTRNERIGNYHKKHHNKGMFGYKK